MNHKVKKSIDTMEAALMGLPLRERIEVIANVIAREGLSRLGSEVTGASLQDMTVATLRHREKNGETIESSLALQGLQMLSWLDA